MSSPWPHRARCIGSAIVVLCAALVATACGQSDPVCSTAPASTVIVGDGFNDAFEPVGEGERILLLIHGSGYYGIQLAVRTSGIDPIDADVSARLTTNGVFVGGSKVSTADGSLSQDTPRFDLSGSFEAGELISAPLTFLASVAPADYINIPATLNIEVADRCGNTATSEQTVLPWWQY